MIQEMNTMEDILTFFKADRFATERLDAVIESYDFQTGEAVTTLEVRPHHLNGHGYVMGGVYFTLADYALAICCNVNQEPTTSVESNVNFMKSCKGAKLRAVARADRAGKSLGFYTIDVFDDLGTHCARMTATCMRV